MQLTRDSGILLHPTSLPGRYGIGELGEEAFKFIDFLVQSHQNIWQLLPLNPPGYGDSPYQCFSAFAGNPLLISIDKLIETELVTTKDLDTFPSFPQKNIDFFLVKKSKYSLFEKAYQRFAKNPDTNSYLDFKDKNSYWLFDYAFFMSLKEYFYEFPWCQWEKAIAWRNPNALSFYAEILQERINFHCFLQYLFFSQWLDLKAYANRKGIKLVGDIPIFISADSSDTWSFPKLFAIDEKGLPTKVAGVPPDYFSETGQLWGNPHYNWQQMAEDDFLWWRQRIGHLLQYVDVLRIDHFRGFESYWEIPAGSVTAIKGRWVKGPGVAFFQTLENYLGKIPIIAEDLGYITPEVNYLREKFNYPGMKILQFISSERISTRHNEENIVYYTGTHDNDTLWGWYQKEIISRLNNTELQAEDICWEFIETIYMSNANWVIIPLQDIFCMDSSARMNIPGTVGNNWNWRFLSTDLTHDIALKLSCLCSLYGR